MRSVWGLISDVHGNLPMLEQALRVLSAAGVHRLAFLGDYLGKGDSDGCVARIRAVADLAVVGNRDLDWQDRVSPASKEWVLSLPRTATAGALLIAHGDSRLTPALSTTQINRDFVRTWHEMERVTAQVLAFGHSHHARVWRKQSAAAPAELLGDAIVELLHDARYVVNVGTTGLPFPGKGGPSIAIIDFASRRIQQLPLSAS
jgi:predicted phosphodiesterase